jgi:hypothetical protein
MSVSDLSVSTDATLAAAIGDVIAEALALRDAQIAALGERVARLEEAVAAGPSVRFGGPWRDGVAYAAGTTVLRGGSLYIATRAAQSGAMPGVYTDDAGDEDTRSPWALCAKKGRDGRDLR